MSEHATNVAAVLPPSPPPGGEGGKTLANRLRAALTPAETVLWKHLRGHRLAGFKFRRQQAVGPFVADFACFAARLIVEVDGETHLGRAAHDERRTAFLAARGWQVFRVWNTVVYDDTESVVETIYRVCVDRSSSPAPAHWRGSKADLLPSPPPGGEGSGERGGRPPTAPLFPEAHGLSSSQRGRPPLSPGPSPPGGGEGSKIDPPPRPTVASAHDGLRSGGTPPATPRSGTEPRRRAGGRP